MEMIKVLLKHIIYETCIGVLFDSIIINFSDISKSQKMINDILEVSDRIAKTSRNGKCESIILSTETFNNIKNCFA